MVYRCIDIGVVKVYCNFIATWISSNTCSFVPFFFNDLRLWRIFYPRFYPIHIFSYLNSWERASIFPFECSVLNKGTTGTIFITSLVWRGPWLGIEPGTSRTRSQHYTTRLSWRRFLFLYNHSLFPENVLIDTDDSINSINLINTSSIGATATVTSDKIQITTVCEYQSSIYVRYGVIS